MACCGGNGGAQRIRTATYKKSEAPPKTVSVRKISRDATPVAIQRQYVIPRNLCPTCNSPTMLVYIANRERQQCTNLDCRLIIQ